MGGDLDLPLLQPLLEVATSLREVHPFMLPWLGTFTTPGVLSRMKGVWLATVTMKPMTKFGLIKPMVFELLERHRAKTLSSASK